MYMLISKRKHVITKKNKWKKNYRYRQVSRRICLDLNQTEGKSAAGQKKKKKKKKKKKNF